MRYRDGCHCGRIACEVEDDFGEAIECNCSHRARKGYLLCFVPREHLALTTPPSELATYRFNKHVIEHHVCPACGCAPFGEGKGEDSAATAAVKVRCVEGIALATIKCNPFDGRSY